MSPTTESGMSDNGTSLPRRVRMRMLAQMAETLEDQAAGLYRRAAASEEEEFLLNREIEERQTEVNRMVLKLEGIRAERERLIEKVDAISEEVAAMREEIFTGEEEFALATIEASAPECANLTEWGGERPVGTNLNPANGAMFFRRATVSE